MVPCRIASKNITSFTPEVNQVSDINNLQMLVQLTPYLRQMIGEDCGLGITDLEKFLYNVNGKLNLPVKAGDAIKAGTITEAVIKSGQKMLKRVPKEVLGEPYVGMGIPVRDDDDRLLGVMTIIKPIDIQEKVSVMAEELSKSMENIATISSGLMSASEQLAATAQDLAENTTGIEKDIREMDNVIALIKEVSDQTHLLGLNAAIEAARAGEHGRGFNVVAGEIRKLAAKTHNSVQEISGKLKHIQETMLGFTTQTHEISAVSQEQAASTEEITASMQKIESMAEELAGVSEELLKL